MLPLLDRDPLFKVLPVNNILHFPLILQSCLLSLQINLVHLSEILEMLFLLSFLRFQILLISSHLGSEKLFTLDFLHFLEVVFSLLFESYGVDAGGLFLHALKSLFIFMISFIPCHLINQVLDPLLLQRLLSLCLFKLSSFHVDLLI